MSINSSINTLNTNVTGFCPCSKKDQAALNAQQISFQSSDTKSFADKRSTKPGSLNLLA